MNVQFDTSAAARQDHSDSLPGSKVLRLLVHKSNDRPEVQPYYQLLGRLGTDLVLKHLGIEGVNVVYDRYFAHSFHCPRASA